MSSWHTRNEIFSVLPISQLRTLNIKHVISDLELTCDLSSIIYLTIYRCDYDRLWKILNNATRLNYLKTDIVDVDTDTFNDSYSTNHNSTSLKQLILMDFDGRFSDVVEILKQTPNLNSLTIASSRDQNMMDACKWEDLITSSLSFLKVFQIPF